MRKLKLKSLKIPPSITISITMLLWFALFILIIATNPHQPLAVMLFFALLTLAIFLPINLIIKPRRRAILITALIIGLLSLRFYHLDQTINLILLPSLIISIELLFVIK